MSPEQIDNLKRDNEYLRAENEALRAKIKALKKAIVVSECRATGGDIRQVALKYKDL